MKSAVAIFAEELEKYAKNWPVRGAKGSRRGKVPAGVTNPTAEPGGAQVGEVAAKVNKKKQKSILKKGNIPVWGSPIKAVV